MENDSKSAVKAAGLMMVITLIGKILGLVREMFLAGNFFSRHGSQRLCGSKPNTAYIF